MVLLAREFGWTIDEMRQLTPRELACILKELQRQIALEEYNEQRNHWAFLAAVVANGASRVAGVFSKRKPKVIEPDDFISKEAQKTLRRLLSEDGQKEADWSRHIEEAKAKRMNGPW